MHARVSCLMGTYGRYNYLKQAVGCFLKQTALRQSHLYIYNQHSVPIKFEHPSVTVINEPTQAMPLRRMRRRMLELADPNSEFIQFWDDDDLYLPWYLEVALANIGDAVAWKPEYSWIYKGGKEYSLFKSTLEATWLFNGKFLRNFEYVEGTHFDSHPAYTYILENNLLATKDLGAKTAFIYRWINSYHHTSAHGNPSDEAAQIQKIERVRQICTDHGNEVPLEPSDTSDIYLDFLKGIYRVADIDDWREVRQELSPYISSLDQESEHGAYYLMSADLRVRVQSSEKIKVRIAEHFHGRVTGSDAFFMSVSIFEDVPDIFSVQIGNGRLRHDLSFEMVLIYLRKILKFLSDFQNGQVRIQ